VDQQRKNTVLNFVNGNIMKGTERRLTMIGHEEMSQENIKRLQDSYKHPFDKIPKNYFRWSSICPNSNDSRNGSVVSSNEGDNIGDAGNRRENSRIRNKRNHGARNGSSNNSSERSSFKQNLERVYVR
jgi:hypothetical protein